VAEALHDSALADVPDLIAALAAELQALKPQTAILTATAPRFTPASRQASAACQP